MKCYLEITSGILRIYRDDQEYGDPFEMVLFLIGDEGVATLKGLKTDHLTIAYRKAINDCLTENGFTGVKWRRRTKGSERELHFKIKK